MTTMRAARFDSYGPPDVLYEGTAPIPRIRPDEVLVRVRAASLNGGELTMRSGKLRLLFNRRFPKAVGIDFTGEIAATGTNVAGLRVGDRVWGVLPRGRFGSAAEFVAVRHDRVSPTPAGLDLVAAAALPVGTTAITALRDKARLRRGERLLVRGASGGVGTVLVQLGHALGAHVTALANGRNLDLVRELGADEAFDYATTAPADLGRFDVVVDTVGAGMAAYRRLLAPGGRMVTITFGSPGAVGYLLASTVFGSRRVRFFSGNPTRPLLADLTAYVERGDIWPVVDTVYPLAEIAAAHRSLEAGGVRGKLVIRIP